MATDITILLSNATVWLKRIREAKEKPSIFVTISTIATFGTTIHVHIHVHDLHYNILKSKNFNSYEPKLLVLVKHLRGLP